jgi:hypothetical protein
VNALRRQTVDPVAQDAPELSTGSNRVAILESIAQDMIISDSEGTDTRNGFPPLWPVDHAKKYPVANEKDLSAIEGMQFGLNEYSHNQSPLIDSMLMFMIVQPINPIDSRLVIFHTRLSDDLLV